MEKLIPFYKRSIYKEKAVTYDENFYKAGKHIYLKGNRQSEKYFKPYSYEIRHILSLKKSIVNKFDSIGKEIRAGYTVAIHIRRGDYLTNIALDVLGLLPMEYYKSAFGLIEQQCNISKAYIFSDDIEWVKQHLELNTQMVFASGELTSNSVEDFYLMSQCSHNIIANSTFSWWAAYLNPNPNKIVIAPKKWFNNAPYDTRDLIPESWIRI